jgi:hypothetical protein
MHHPSIVQLRFGAWRRKRYAERWAAFGIVMKPMQGAVRAANALRHVAKLRAEMAERVRNRIALQRATNVACDAAVAVARAAANAVDDLADAAMRTAIVAGAAAALDSAVRAAQRSAEFARAIANEALDATEAAQRAKVSLLLLPLYFTRILLTV